MEAWRPPLMQDDLLKKLGIQGVEAVQHRVENLADTHDYQDRKDLELGDVDWSERWYEVHNEDDELDRDQVQDMIAASEARTDTKFARLEGKLDLILERFESSSSKSTMQIQALADQEAAERDHVRGELSQIRGDYKSTRNTVIGTGISVVVLVVAILTLYVSALSTGAALAPSHESAVSAPQSNQIGAQPTQKFLPAPIQNKN